MPVDIGYAEKRYERIRPEEQYVLTSKLNDQVKQAE